MAAAGVPECVKIQETTLEQYLILNLLYAVKNPVGGFRWEVGGQLRWKITINF